MTCSLCETGLNFRCNIIPPRLPLGKFWGIWGKLFFVPQTKQFVFGGFLGGNLFLSVPLNIEICLGGFPGGN